MIKVATKAEASIVDIETKKRRIKG